MKIPIQSNSQFSLFSNFGWLSVSHGINFILPLVIYPYLLRVIGVQNFGLVMLAQATVMYLVNFMDYGFSLSGIRDVSVNRDNKDRLFDIYSRVMSTKFLLLIASVILLTLLLFLVPKMSGNQLLFASSFAIVIGQWLLPFWFLQGLEKMRWVAILNVISKLIFLVLILVYIKEANDYIWVNLYLGLSQIVIGTITILTLMITYRTIPGLSSIGTVLQQLKTNFLLFTSNFSSYVSSNSTLVIFGLIADPIALGYYAVAEKILLIIKAPAVLLYQAVYPRVCATAELSMDKLIELSRKINQWVYVLFIPIALITCLFAHEIIFLFTGEALEEPVILLYIISIVPLIVALNIPGTQALIAFKLDRSYSLITVSAAVFSVVLTIAMSYYFAAQGAAVSILVTEFCVTTMIYITLTRKRKDYNALSVLNWAKVVNFLKVN